MDKTLAISVFESLSSGVWLDIFRLLVKAGSQGLVVGEIGRALDVPPTNLSFHLKALAHAQRVSVAHEGRYLAPQGWHGMSAGSHPSGYVHPRSLAFLGLPLPTLLSDPLAATQSRAGSDWHADRSSIMKARP